MKQNIKTINYFSIKLNNFNINVTLLIFLVYFLSITSIPVLNTNTFTKCNNFSRQNNNLLVNFKLNKTFNVKDIKAIYTLSYINNFEMLDRQIDNDNLQAFINNAKGYILKLNDYSNNANNEIYSYDAYGNVIVVSSSLPTSDSKSNNLNNISFREFDKKLNSAIPNPFQYNSERFDNNSKLQYLRARFYNPEIKRFINQDSYDLLNKFGYVDGNPVMRNDSSGNNWNDFVSFISNTWNAGINQKIGLIIGGVLISAIALAGVIAIKSCINVRRNFSTSTIVNNKSKNIFTSKEYNVPEVVESFLLKVRTQFVSYLQEYQKNNPSSKLGPDYTHFAVRKFLKINSQFRPQQLNNKENIENYIEYYSGIFTELSHYTNQIDEKKHDNNSNILDDFICQRRVEAYHNFVILTNVLNTFLTRVSFNPYARISIFEIEETKTFDSKKILRVPCYPSSQLGITTHIPLK